MSVTVEELITRLRRDPSDREAFSTLRKHYHRMADYASLANLLEGWASQNPDSNAAADTFVEASKYAQGLADPLRGFSLLERALQRSPTHAEASDQLEALVEQSKDYDRLVRLIQQRIQLLSKQNENTPALAMLHFRLAELWRHRFSRTDRAVYHYRKAFEIDSSMVAAIYAARELYRNEGNWRMAATLCEQEAHAEQDPTRKASLLRELAGIRHMHLNDQKGAIAALTQAAELAASDVNILYELAGLLLQDAAQSKTPTSASTPKKKAADLLYQVAQLTLKELQTLTDEQGPIPDAHMFQRNFLQHALAYAQAALDANPGHANALQLLESLTSELGSYEQLMPERWVAFLETSPEDAAAVPVRQKLGHAYANAGQIHDAVVCLEPLLDLSDAWAAQVLVGLYQSLDNPSGVERALTILIQALPPEQRIDRLREMVHVLTSTDRRDEAIAYAEQALAIAPADAEMLGFLEDVFQGMNRWNELRDLSLAAARVPGLSVEAKQHRLRQAARISEEHLSDTDGAIGAWRAVASLDPTNQEARDALERLLRDANRWDDLIQVLERSALAHTLAQEQGRTFHAIAHIHRDKRKDPNAAIEYLFKVQALSTDIPESTAELSELLIEEGRYQEAIPLLHQRLETSENTRDRAYVLRTLAHVLEERIGDDEAALGVYRTLLEENPDHLEAIQGLERIDARAKRYDKLLETLGYHAELVDTKERSEIYIRMGNIADRELEDLEKAAGYYRQAVELNPTDSTTLDALCNLFERTSRHQDLVVYLRRRAELETDPSSKVELYRRVARTFAESLHNPDAAVEVWNKLIEIQPDFEALKALRAHYEQHNEYDKLNTTLEQLAALAEDSSEKRTLLYAQAEVLHKHLNQPSDAIRVLRTIVQDHDDRFVPALDLLIELTAKEQDHAHLADALERKLALTENSKKQINLAKQLVELYDGPLNQPEHAERALVRWSEADPQDPEPHRQLVTKRRDTERPQELLTSLDTLTRLEPDEGLRQGFAIEAARLAYDRLQDTDGAWQRLLPLIPKDNPEAANALSELAKATDRGLQLASVYVELAQRTEEDIEKQGTYWKTAAEIYETYTTEKTEALEAMLRALATNLSNEAYLDEVDRLAIDNEAWRRLEQVYDTLLRNTDDTDHKVSLLFRHAAILEDKAKDASTALDRLLRATALKPEDPELIARIETLARANERAEELLVIYDRLRTRADNPRAMVDALIRSVRTCAWDLANPKRALQYLSQAAQIAVQEPELAKEVEDLADEMDEAFAKTETNLGEAKADARNTLIDSYSQLYSQGRTEATPHALIHIARYLSQKAHRKTQALEALKTAANLDPGNPEVLDSLMQLCTEENMLPELATLLEGLADDAMDAVTAATLLERRGKLLEETLERHEEAAQSYQQLLLLRHDKDIAERLHRCLRRTAKFNELLVALGRALDRTEIPDERFALYREIARVWEDELRNRFEAIEALQKALQIRPDDRDTVEHLERLTRIERPTEDEIWQDVDEQNEVIEETSTKSIPPQEANALMSQQPSIPPPLPAEEEAEKSEDDNDNVDIDIEDKDL